VSSVDTRSIRKGVVLLDVFGNDICDRIGITTRHTKMTDKRAVASLAAKEEEARDSQ
jgi:hypothetical protein